MLVDDTPDILLTLGRNRSRTVLFSTNGSFSITPTRTKLQRWGWERVPDGESASRPKGR